MPKHASFALALLALAACSDDKTPEPSPDDDDGTGEETSLDASRPDGSRPDSSRPIDASTDARSNTSDDGGSTSPDTGAPDSGPPPLTCDASKAPTLPPLKLEAVAGVNSLSRLVDAEQPKGSTDWYLVQQSGTVRILRDGALVDGSFVDVRDQITLVGDGDERGLLGIAFPPDYVDSGIFYIAVSATKGPNNVAGRDTVYQYERSTDGLSSMPTGIRIIQLPASAQNHNGGNLQFGPDGFLYFGSGDGGGGCNSDEPGTPQDPTSPFGKIHRFDPKASAPYAAAGNPYNGTDGLTTVLHYGLRNPFRFGFDRLTGDLYIGDVGQDAYEEVSYAEAGAKALNFGWPVFEGAHKTPPPCPQSAALNPGSTDTKPIVDLPQNTGIWGDYISVIGGVVYRGSAIPTLQGVYLFGDYTAQRMGAIYQCGDQTSEPTVLLKKRNPNMPNQPGFQLPDGISDFSQLTAIVEDNAGELYFVANRSALWKVVPGT
jgi:glucose/arabinose dehydrogenase